MAGHGQEAGAAGQFLWARSGAVTSRRGHVRQAGLRREGERRANQGAREGFQKGEDEEEERQLYGRQNLHGCQLHTV